MAIVDDRGRLLGKVNIIDAVVVVVVLMLIPLAYGAYLLFRTPAVHITGVEPASVTQGASEVTLHGEHLRPYLHAAVGGQEATYLFQSPSAAVLKLPPMLGTGTHEVVLSDEGQTVAMLSQALTVKAALVPVASIGAPDQHPEVAVLGAFRGLERDVARALSGQLAAIAGQDQPWGRVSGVLDPEINVEYLEPAAMLVTDRRYEVRAVLRLRCTLSVAQCLAGGTAVAPHAVIPIGVTPQNPRFVVDEVDPVPSGFVTVTLRATVVDSLFRVIRHPAEDQVERALADVRAVVQSASPVFAVPDGTQPSTVLVRVPVAKTSAGWLYRGKPLRLGDPLVVEHPQYTFSGTIVGIQE